MPLPLLALVAIGVAGVAVAASSSSSSSSSSSTSSSSSCGPVKPLGNLAPFDPLKPIDAGELLPEGSPDGFHWLLWQGPKTAPFFNGLGLDSAGNFWTYGQVPFSGTAGRYVGMIWQPGTPPKTGFFRVTFGGSSFLDSVADAVRDYVLPALAVAASVFIPGVGGLAAAAVIVAMSRMAKGASLTDAVVAAARDNLPSLKDSAAFNRAFLDASNAYDATKSVTKTIGDLSTKKAALPTEDARNAYDLGVSMGLARKLQADAVAWLKAALPDHAGTIDLAMSRGAALVDVAQVLGGDGGVCFVEKILAGEKPALPTNNLITIVGGSCCSACARAGTRQGAPLPR